MCVCSILSNSVTPWTAACHPPLSMEFSRQEYWSGLPFPTPGDLPHPGIESVSPAWQVDSLPLCHLGNLYVYYTSIKLSYKILFTTYAYKGLNYFLSRNDQQVLPISLESILPSFLVFSCS